MSGSLLIISPFYFQETAARAIQVRKLCKGLNEFLADYYLATFIEDKQQLTDPAIIELKDTRKLSDRYRDGPVSINVKYLNQFIRNNDISAVLTISSPSFTTFLGLYLKKKNPAIKWISYFSDPVPESAYPPPYFNGFSAFRKRIKFWYQEYKVNKAFNKSDALIFPSTKTLEHIESHFNKSLAHKSHIIPHIGGTALHKNQPNADILFEGYLVYFGSLYNRSSKSLIEALKRANSDFPDHFKGLICFGTHVPDEFKNLIKEYEVQDLIQIRKKVRYNESLEWMSRSHVLLLIEADIGESPFMPSKFFDYLFSNRPILAVSPKKNSLNEHYSNSDDLRVVEHDSDEIYHAVKKLFCNPVKNINRNLGHLERREIVQKYLEILEP